ncbi:MAG: hypothetical protein ACOVOO_04220 [Flavobacteriales bacterium]|jgi:hypothetical protein
MNKKKIIFLLPIVLAAVAQLSFITPTSVVSDDCTFKGKKLFGKIRFVESFPDVKVQFVESFPDLKVKFVDSFADDCGEWQVVESFPDLKVQIVNSFPDVKVKVVDSFPGR